TNDFSFKDKVYDTVGDALTYLNEIKPISLEEVSGDVTSGDVATKDVVSEDETSGNVASDKSVSEAQASSQVADESENGAGGEPNPVDENGMPTNATFAPIIYTGPITFPIVKDYHITSTFGFRDHPSQGISEFHTAVDIGAVKGTPIKAAADGVVIKSEKSGSLGNHIIIDHSNGFLTVYGHCDKLIAKVGARIREGEIIAKVGSTGDSTGNHLHFAMKKDGLYFDPSYIFKEELNVKV
ncbi:MAG: M23 family metallopeptidase, partial [Oscillospiraceae bacterium]